MFHKNLRTKNSMLASIIVAAALAAIAGYHPAAAQSAWAPVRSDRGYMPLAADDPPSTTCAALCPSL